MKLTLRIENIDFLPDGGPLEYTVTDRGFEAGRDSAMDWTLPDPHRHVSGRHFEVIFRQGRFWLNDVSTNGTYLFGQSMRLPAAHELMHNDRLQVGHYVIRAVIEDTPQPAQHGSWAAPARPAADPWSIGGDFGAAPAPATPLPPPNRPAQALPGVYGDGFIDMAGGGAAGAAPMPSSPPFGMPPLHSQPPQHSQPVHSYPPAPAFAPELSQPPTPSPLPMPGAVPPPMAAPPRPAVQPFGGMPHAEPFAPVARPAAPMPAAAPAADAGLGSFLNAICRGAGLPPGSFDRVEPDRLGEEIGQALRLTTESLMALLGARAAAKQFVKSGSRTMIGGMNNSPLKFKPTAREAMETMYVQRPESYLSATAALEQGFDDIRRHQTAVYAAMQPALARLLEDLAPESIEERASGGLVTSKKARAWELFVERWDAKTHPYENGMLDLFLAYFAEAYDDAVKKTGG